MQGELLEPGPSVPSNDPDVRTAQAVHVPARIDFFVDRVRQRDLHDTVRGDRPALRGHAGAVMVRIDPQPQPIPNAIRGRNPPVPIPTQRRLVMLSQSLEPMPCSSSILEKRAVPEQLAPVIHPAVRMVINPEERLLRFGIGPPEPLRHSVARQIERNRIVDTRRVDAVPVQVEDERTALRPRALWPPPVSIDVSHTGGLPVQG